MESTILEDSTANRVVVHKVERLAGNVWTATFSAYHKDQQVLHEQNATYTCFPAGAMQYYRGPYNDDNVPSVEMRETICDALWLAWLREYRQERESKRQGRPASAEIPQSRERGLRA